MKVGFAVWSPLFVAALGACKGSRSAPGPDASTATTTTTTTATTTTTTTTTTAGPRGCESMMQRGPISFRGSTTAPSAPLATGDPIPERATIDLGEGAELTVRTSTHREITVTGPATAAFCSDGPDGVVLSRGKLSAYPGTGVRPGSEVWVATPLGVVRYSDAKIDIDVQGAEGTRLVTSAAVGQADFLPAPDVQLDPVPDEKSGDFTLGVRLKAGRSFSAGRPPKPLKRLLTELVRACTRESEAAARAAQALLSAGKGDGGPFGERASEHVRARQRARSACETARAAASLGPGVLDGALAAELATADEKRNQLTPLPARR